MAVREKGTAAGIGVPTVRVGCRGNPYQRRATVLLEAKFAKVKRE